MPFSGIPNRLQNGGATLTLPGDGSINAQPASGKAFNSLDPNGYVIPQVAGTYTPNGWDAAWRTAKAAAIAGTASARLVAIGASWIEGYNASDMMTTAWLGLLRTNLVARGIPLAALFFPSCQAVNWGGGSGWVGSTPPWVLPTAGSFTSALGGFCGFPDFAASATFPILTFQPPQNCTALDVVYYDGASGQNTQTFQFQVDAGTVRTVTMTGNHGIGLLSATGFSSDFSGLASGLHTIKIGNTSATNTMRILGGIAYPTGIPQKGLKLARCGKGGLGWANDFGSATTFPATSGETLPIDGALKWQGSRNNTSADTSFDWPLKGDLYILSTGNDVKWGIGPQATARVLERVIKAARRGVPNCSILLFNECMSGDYSDDNQLSNAMTPNWVNEMRLVSALARSYQCAFVSFTELWSGNGVGSGYLTSGVLDPPDAGHANVAAVIEGLV